MENKIYANPKYKCAICGEVYDKVENRMKCESACLKKQAEEAKRAAEEKKKLEQKARKAELDLAVENVIKLREAYVKDYGSYRYTFKPEFKDLTVESDDFLPLKLWADMFF